MKNILKWTNLTAAPFTLKIYRGTAPLDKASPGTAIATLTNSETQYEDDTVTRGTQYYYMIETIKGSESSFSNNIPLQALPRRGPGPVQLKTGDYDYGYFGTIPSREFINTQQLMSAVGSVNILSLANGARLQEAPVWHKYARKGKVLFIPNGPLVKGTNWKLIYDDGLVYGVDGPGPSNAGTNVNQNKVVTIAGSNFLVRLMTGYDDNPANIPPTETVTEAVYPNLCEWNDLVYPLSEYTPLMQRMANVQQATRAQLSIAAGGYSLMTFVQERVAGGNAFTAGTHNQENRACIAGRSNSAINGTTTALAGNWWPVLELIEA